MAILKQKNLNDRQYVREVMDNLGMTLKGRIRKDMRDELEAKKEARCPKCGAFVKCDTGEDCICVDCAI